jgi:hypothetical protein
VQGNYLKYLKQEFRASVLRCLRNHANYSHIPGCNNLTTNNLYQRVKGLENVMPRKPKSSVQSAVTSRKLSQPDTRWLNYKLTETDVPAVLAIADEQESIADGLIGLLTLGADVQARYNVDRANWSAFAIYPRGDGSDCRYAISAYGGTQWQAIAALLYKCDLYATSPDTLSESGKGMGIG